MVAAAVAGATLKTVLGSVTGVGASEDGWFIEPSAGTGGESGSFEAGATALGAGAGASRSKLARGQRPRETSQGPAPGREAAEWAAPEARASSTRPEPGMRAMGGAGEGGCCWRERGDERSKKIEGILVHKF